MYACGGGELLPVVGLLNFVGVGFAELRFPESLGFSFKLKLGSYSFHSPLDERVELSWRLADMQGVYF
jgi:hypothetical protein